MDKYESRMTPRFLAESEKDTPGEEENMLGEEGDIKVVPHVDNDNYSDYAE